MVFTCSSCDCLAAMPSGISTEHNDRWCESVFHACLDVARCALGEVCVSICDDGRGCECITWRTACVTGRKS
jgi:hypothetical protein